MVVSGFFCHQLAKVAGSERYDVTGPPEVRYVPGEVLVRFAPKANGVQRTTAEKNQVLSSLGGGTVEYEFWLVPGGSLVKLPPQMSVETAVQVFNKAEGIIYAHPNSELTPLSTIPNDPNFDNLWGMTQIHAPEAWDYSTGSSDIIVAVVDSGVDYTHPDLAANMWVNTDEIPGNGIDDDGNGYVDDIYGYDFYWDPVTHPRDPDPMDEYGHGTKMAGILGAVGNNSEGVVGVCWNVRIMALKFAGSHGMGNTGDTVLALQYAVVNGADVVNYSYGSTWTEQMPFLEDAIEQAGNLGLLFVAGAGNSNQDNDVSPSFYPASCDCNNIIAVLVTTYDDSRWYEDQYHASNYGLTTVDLGAPGPRILTCRWGGGYDYIDKTSAATAHVSGACALLWAAFQSVYLRQNLQFIVNICLIRIAISYKKFAGQCEP
jgi:subtilisin family serine protease